MPSVWQQQWQFLHCFPSKTNSWEEDRRWTDRNSEIQNGQWQLMQSVLCCNADSDREGRDMSSNHLRYNCGFKLLLQLSAMETAPSLLTRTLNMITMIEYLFSSMKISKDNNSLVIEFHAALYLRKWDGSKPVMLLENCCYYVCQGAIPSPQQDWHFLPAYTVPW